MTVLCLILRFILYNMLKILNRRSVTVLNRRSDPLLVALCGN